VAAVSDHQDRGVTALREAIRMDGARAGCCRKQENSSVHQLVVDAQDIMYPWT
jgi:hypothetical protein